MVDEQEQLSVKLSGKQIKNIRKSSKK